MIDKFVRSVAEALDGVKDGSTVLIAGFAQVGEPRALIDGLIEQGARDLTVVHNTAGRGREGVARLIGEGRVRKIVCSFARSRGSVIFEEVFARGGIELEILPQGTMAERMRAAAADRGVLCPEELPAPGLYVARLVQVAAGRPPIKIE